MPGIGRALFLEGVPGTGKSTTARRLCKSLRARGLPCETWREEDPDHPATPKRLRASAAQPGFAERCLASFRDFTHARDGAEGSCVLEASAFQSTIRFMLEHERPRAEILAYVGAFARAVAPLEPRLAYFEAPDPRRFLTDFVLPKRGPEWVAKVTAHVASTPYGVARGGSGAAALVDFWLDYAALCEQALDVLDFPVVRIETGPGRWSAAHAALVDWLTRAREDARPATPPR